MSAVFISYRREDAEGQARALSTELAGVIGKASVFMDVDNIALGRDFREVLQESLGSCDILLALIGPEWLNARDGSGKRRLDSPRDFVRLEIASALKRNIPVTPVLVRGAKMPAQEQLPDDLKDLAFRNGFELSHTRWDSDVREMVKRLGLSQVEVRPASPQPAARLPEAYPAHAATATSGGDGSPRFGKWAMIGVAVMAAIYLVWPKDESAAPPAKQPTAAAKPSASTVYTYKVGNLEWTTRSKKSVDWNAAAAYCKNLSGAKSGWRLPTRRELRTLYDPKDVDAFGRKVMRPFQAGLDGNWVWSSDKDTASSAFVVDFNNGKDVSLAVNFAEGACALCVRP